MNPKRTSLVLASLASIILAGCGAPVQTTVNADRGLSTAFNLKGSPTTGTKRAFLVGINQYQLPGNNLQGCVNDLEDVKSQMLNKEGFSAANINAITDKKATRTNILEGLKKLVNDGKPGDFLYFHYSGHGAQIADTNGDESDGQDEILCPTDLKVANNILTNAVVDDEIQTILGALKPGVGFMMVSDSCHSGTIDRGIGFFRKGNIRTIRLSKSLRNATPLIYNASLQASYRAKAAAGKYVVISGCQDEQTSADANINNRYNGAATFYLLEAYKKGGANQTWSQLHQKMLAGLIENSYEQRPALTGPGNTKIFTIPE
ncbi:MAG TPA: hypothetical protein DD435_08430 [Cyanobacteria bacterium UBA8530]|nr:hypothetical protein [Cyanobacteria bacterium UBA8530]